MNTSKVTLATESDYFWLSASGEVVESSAWGDLAVALTSLVAGQGWRWERIDEGGVYHFMFPESKHEREALREVIVGHVQALCHRCGVSFHTVFMKRMTSA